ncbi:MAG: hypothetical protein NTX50_04110 [Candidatus Sumerlaeota bacterium]|nr:hypothetical protein [Candidatus Sumerlaeota bacterium]
MPENLEQFDRYLDRHDQMLDFEECVLMRYMPVIERDAENEKEAYEAIKDFSMTQRRLQEGRESYFTEWHKIRALKQSPDLAAAEASRTEAEKALREACERDVARFAREFFHEYCRLAPSVFHRWVFREYNRRAGMKPPLREGRRLALAAPRGHAKSTLQSLILPIHSLLYQREKYIVILSATLKQSQQKLEAIGYQLQRNARLHRVFGAAESKDAKFSSTVIEAFDTRIEAYSAGSEVRGLVHKGYRPTLVILDDVEDSESVESGEQREKLAAWFSEVIEHLGNGYTNLTIVGTLLHPQSLLASLLKRPDFKTARFRAVRAFAKRADLWERWRELYSNLRDPARIKTAQTFFYEHKREMLEGARALWPEKETYYKLMIQLATQGRRAFFQEKQNDPSLADVAIFDPARARHFRLERDALVLETSPSAEDRSTGSKGTGGDGERVELAELTVAGFLDAAMGKSASSGRTRGGDYAALVTVGADAHGFIYVLDARVERARPSQQAQWVFDLAERWGHRVIGVEGNCFQELMMIPIEDERARRRAGKRPCQVAVEPVSNRASKDARIRSLESLIENGILRFARGLGETFLQQLEGYPGRYDDGPDALAGAVELVRRNQSGAPLKAQSRKRESRAPLRNF